MLTDERRKLLKEIRFGADVWNRKVAEIFREMEKEEPKLIRIVKPRMAPQNGADAQPYFGVKLTAAGV